MMRVPGIIKNSYFFRGSIPERAIKVHDSKDCSHRQQSSLTLIHHQNATCGVSCGKSPLRRIQIRLRVLLPPFLKSGCLGSGILLVARK